MSDPKLPGLSRLKEQELRDLYEQEVGQPAPAELTTVDALRDALKDHRAGAPDDETDEAAAAEAASVATDTVTVTHATLPGPRTFTKQSWDALGTDKGGWQLQVPKPKDLN